MSLPPYAPIGQQVLVSTVTVHVLSAGARPYRLNVVLDRVVDVLSRNTLKFIDTTVAHAVEMFAAPVGGRPGDAIGVGVLVIAFVGESVFRLAGNRCHGHCPFASSARSIVLIADETAATGAPGCLHALDLISVVPSPMAREMPPLFELLFTRQRSMIERPGAYRTRHLICDRKPSPVSPTLPLTTQGPFQHRRSSPRRVLFR